MFRAPIYGAHCAVISAIVQLSSVLREIKEQCYNFHCQIVLLSTYCTDLHLDADEILHHTRILYAQPSRQYFVHTFHVQYYSSL